jgi:hypothetical protein
MKSYVAAAFAAGLVTAVVSFSYAQTPPGTDRKAGEAGTTSAKPDPDKKSPPTTKAAPKGGTQTPPGTDRPAGEEGGTSAKPSPDKKQKQ